MSMQILYGGLLIIGGLIHALPPIADDLRKLAWGIPILQMLIGFVSIIIGFGSMTQLF